MANDLLEKGFDSAYCDGIACFGKRGSFPYEKYHVFDCMVKRNGRTCFDWRLKSVKASPLGYWRLKSMRLGTCYSRLDVKCKPSRGPCGPSTLSSVA